MALRTMRRGQAARGLHKCMSEHFSDLIECTHRTRPLKIQDLKIPKLLSVCAVYCTVRCDGPAEFDRRNSRVSKSRMRREGHHHAGAPFQRVRLYDSPMDKCRSAKGTVRRRSVAYGTYSSTFIQYLPYKAPGL